MSEPVVLLVEDEALVILVAQDALEAGGFAVIPISTGAEAIRVLDERSAEVAGLVTDIQLGSGPNGWDVGRHARELRPDLPIVYTTGDSGTQWPAQGVPNSVLVQKPYAPAQLLTAVSTLMTTADTNRAS